MWLLLHQAFTAINKSLKSDLVARIKYSSVESNEELLTGIIIIIMSCYKHGIPWLSLPLSVSLSRAIRLYLPPLPTGPLDYIMCPYRAVVNWFKLFLQHFHVRVKGSIGERRLWVRFYFSNSVRHVLYVLFG